MITSTIGKLFLKAYNEKHGTQYDAKTFFVEVYHPLFYDSNKYLQWVQNSPFVQMEQKKGQKVENLTSEERQEKLQVFLKKVDECITPDASIAPGFPASEEKEFATTSGQVTNLNLSTSKDDIYLSWFGSSLGVGLQGGLSILFSEPEVLLELFDGWILYRNILKETSQLKGNQVNTWNGQWLAHRYDKGNFYSSQPMAGFSPFETTKDGMCVATQSWTKVIIGIAKQFQSPKIIGYIYNLGQTNTTIGFIPFALDHIRKPLELYQKLFGNTEGKKAEELWGTENGFRVCCQKGAIGIEAMQPKGLTPYITALKDSKVKLPKYKENDEEQKITYHTYQIWLLAMLNNQELWDKSLEFAQALHTFVKKDKSRSTKRENLVENIISSTSKKTFMNSLAEIIEDVESLSQIEENAKIIHMMPTDNVPYYLTLIRFHYAALNNKHSQQSLPLEFN